MAINTILAYFQSFIPGPRLIDGGDLLQQANLLFSTKSGITATVGGTQATSAQLIRAYNEVDPATASGTDSVVIMQPAIPGANIALYNASGQTIKVFGQASNAANGGVGDTIAAANSDAQQATATGVTHADTTVFNYTCFKLGQWKQN